MNVWKKNHGCQKIFCSFSCSSRLLDERLVASGGAEELDSSRTADRTLAVVQWMGKRKNAASSEKPTARQLKAWSPSEVVKFLETAGLKRACVCFRGRGCQRTGAPSTCEDLKELGINKMGQRKSLLQRINSVVKDRRADFSYGTHCRRCKVFISSRPGFQSQRVAAWCASPGQRGRIWIL